MLSSRTHLRKPRTNFRAATGSGALTVSGWSIDSRTINPAIASSPCAVRRTTATTTSQTCSKRERRWRSSSSEGDAAIPQIVVPDTLVALQELARKARRRLGWHCRRSHRQRRQDHHQRRHRQPAEHRNTDGTHHRQLQQSLRRAAFDSAPAGRLPRRGHRNGHESRRRNSRSGANREAADRSCDQCWLGACRVFSDDGIEGVALAKRELIEELPPDGIAVLNADDERVRAFREHSSGPLDSVWLLRKTPRCAPRTCTCARTARTSAVSASNLNSPLAGRHGVSNVLAAIAVARALGIAPETLVDAVRTLAIGKMRGERFERERNHNHQRQLQRKSRSHALHAGTASGTPARRRIAVLGEMLELGREAGTSAPRHRTIRRGAGD